ncbi:DUF4870 domain-containing protein [Pseudomonas sp. SA3-5]|uniref:DUF4870 domain-containing protein n=2 Tax=Pseudomonas TaxID=286 RepID=A0ABT4XFM2_9PSED|nr:MULTISPECIES: DUF4870 domain-containing protein [Pseudomonas]MCG4452704.1 DUF4870 domain-containing protein [Pseudomonas sp. MMS21 TM103]MDA7086992.1 DUF4870 domain-containing protein [Pseudomonas aestuarii]
MEPQDLVPTPTPEARQWAMFCHYAAFFWFLVPMIGNVIGPLIVWQLKKDLDPFVNEQGKEALNFQITFSLAMIVCGILAWVVIGFPLMLLVSVSALVLTIIAGIKANAGEAYRYPICWRVVK